MKWGLGARGVVFSFSFWFMNVDVCVYEEGWLYVQFVNLGLLIFVYTFFFLFVDTISGVGGVGFGLVV